MPHITRIAATALILSLTPPLCGGATVRATQRGSSPPPVRTQEGAFDRDAVAIFALLNRMSADWNRGDIDAFSTGYKDSPEILFIGRTVQHGYAHMVAGYKAQYPTREAMGTLTLTQLAAQGLDARFATATGHFHLERTPQAGGPQDGYFMLVLEKTPAGWKIVRDDTTVPCAR